MSKRKKRLKVIEGSREPASKVLTNRQLITSLSNLIEKDGAWAESVNGADIVDYLAIIGVPGMSACYLWYISFYGRYGEYCTKEKK